MTTPEVRSSVWAGATSILSTGVGWIKVDTIIEAGIVAVISTIIGFFVGKILEWADKKIKAWLIKRNQDKKAQ